MGRARGIVTHTDAPAFRPPPQPSGSPSLATCLGAGFEPARVGPRLRRVLAVPIGERGSTSVGAVVCSGRAVCHPPHRPRLCTPSWFAALTRVTGTVERRSLCHRGDTSVPQCPGAGYEPACDGQWPSFGAIPALRVCPPRRPGLLGSHLRTRIRYAPLALAPATVTRPRRLAATGTIATAKSTETY